ncbi:MAG: DUF58 domain-containing protein [Ktedonobacteraceae bacterium]|nr:DUF58 domain-containing protein [Ktedonobacteraceae bacterium]
MWPDLFRRRQTGAPPRQEETIGQKETPDRLLRRVRWTILRPIAASLWGDERSRYRSPAMELTEVRPYQAGDDIRFIDWNITARTEQPVVRIAQMERAVDVWFLIDLSASMQWETALCLKQERALEFAAVAGQVLNRNGNRLGAIFFADQPLEIVPPAAGRLHLLRLLSELRERANQKRKESTNLEAALKQAETVITRPSLILVISDFLTPSGWQMLRVSWLYDTKWWQYVSLIHARAHYPMSA